MNNKEFYCPAYTDFPDIELYMDQVISVLEKHLEPYFGEEKCITSTMINNYVKNHILPPPENKRYGRGHLAHLYIICFFKQFMQLSDISVLLEKLWEELGEEKAYTLFRRELERAYCAVSQSEPVSAPVPATVAQQVLRTACVAAIAILHSRHVFLEAGFVPRDQEEEQKEKARKEKEKEDKEREKREKKEKKEKKVKEKKD